MLLDDRLFFSLKVSATAIVSTGRLQADYAEKESGVNSMAFVERKRGGNGETEGLTLLATGGEDGVLRVWELHANASSECHWLIDKTCWFSL